MKRIKAVLGKKWTYLLLLVALGWIFGCGFSLTGTLPWLFGALQGRWGFMTFWPAWGANILPLPGHEAAVYRLPLSDPGAYDCNGRTGTLRRRGGAEDPACAYVVVLGAGGQWNPTLPLSGRAFGGGFGVSSDVSGGTVCGFRRAGRRREYHRGFVYVTWLTDRGIPPERIWQEERASSTQENLRFSLELIQEKTGSRPQELAVVSSEYHLYRASCMAKEEGWNAWASPQRPTLWFCGYTMDSGRFLRLVFPAVWQITTWKENMTWISNTQAMLPSKRRHFWG